MVDGKRLFFSRRAFVLFVAIGLAVTFCGMWFLQSRRAHLTAEMFRLIRKEAPVSEIRRLLDAGIDPNARDLDEEAPSPFLDKIRRVWSGGPSEASPKRDTVLSLAAFFGKADIVKLILDSGARINEPGRDGRTPLMAACNTHSFDVAVLLLNRGADPNAKDEMGYSALYLASVPHSSGKLTYDTKLIKLLKKHGARE